MLVTISGQFLTVAEFDKIARAWDMGGGSEKQTSWAKTIRRQFLADILNDTYEDCSRDHYGDIAWQRAVGQQIADRVQRAVNARWWIDNRDRISQTTMGKDIAAIQSANR